jgi:hypothetical protein
VTEGVRAGHIVKPFRRGVQQAATLATKVEVKSDTAIVLMILLHFDFYYNVINNYFNYKINAFFLKMQMRLKNMNTK